VDRIKMMLDNMENLSDDELAELQTSIVSEFESVEKEEPTPQTVEAMTSLADMLDTVRGETSRREVMATELAQQVTEATDRVYGTEEVNDEAVEESTENNPEESAKENHKEMPAAPAEETVETALEAETAEEVEDKKEGELAVEAEVTLSDDSEEAPATEAAAEVAEGSELSTEETTEVTSEEVALSNETTVAPAEVQEEIVEAPVTAAASHENLELEVPADRRPVVNEIPVAITAGADIPGVTAGSNFNDMSDVADAFSKRLHGLRRVNGGDGEQHIIASFSTQYPEALQLGTNAEENWAKIQDVSGPKSLVASGGYQSPFATRYEVFGLGTNVRPVRDCLPSFQADRGGVRYIVPPVLSSYGSAVGVWSTTLDTAYVTDSYVSSAVKDSLVVEAASETTAVADAVTLQLQFGNLATRAYPELIARHNELGLIQHAREAEQNLLSKIATGSTAVTSTSVLGVAADFLLQIGRAASHYRLRHRMDADATLRLVAPIWVRDAIAADFALQMPGDSKLSVTYSEIDALLASRGVNACWTIDADLPAAQSTGAMTEFKDTFVWYLFAEGTFLFLDGGTLDLGVIRDSTLVGTNDYKMFVETFEGIAKVGVESIAVTSTIQVNGARAALRDTLGATTATTVEF
jgi:chemotaxis protein histidine kinase CheA